MLISNKKFQPLSEEDLAALMRKRSAEKSIVLGDSKKVFKSNLSKEVAMEVEKGNSLPDDLDLDKFNLAKTEYMPLDFKDTVEMLYYFDDNLRNGRRTLHDWQTETNKYICEPSKFTFQYPLEYNLCAANGSGKDAYVIATYPLWKLLTHIRSRVIITSSSAAQLQGQTESYIRSYGFMINKKLQEQGIVDNGPFLIKKNHIINLLTGSEIKTFVTDDAGRAEGYHPFPDSTPVFEGPELGGQLTIIINEAKTVPKDIFEALGRCTFNRWLNVSTPGDTSGPFYESFTKSNLYSSPYIPGHPVSRRVTSYDCSHIPREKIERDKVKWGENSILFRSKHLALFTSFGENVVIPDDLIEKCYV
jgi:hypothetical protein